MPPYCPLNAAEEVVRTTFADEVVDRLYVLNAWRAAEEEELRLKKSPTKKQRAKDLASKQSKKEPASAISLPGMSGVEEAS